MDRDTDVPPPSYAEAIRLARVTRSSSTSDPQLASGDNRDFISALENNLYSGNWGSYSQQFLNAHGETATLQPGISESPHSSDDEETALLKKRLRWIKEEKRLKEENERKRLLLQQLLEYEERSAGTSGESDVGSARRPQAFPPETSYASGTVTHPGVSSVIEHPVTDSRNSDLHPSYHTSPSAPVASNQVENPNVTVYPITTYTPGTTSTGDTGASDGLGKVCLEWICTIVAGAFIAIIVIAIVGAT